MSAAAPARRPRKRAAAALAAAALAALWLLARSPLLAAPPPPRPRAPPPGGAVAAALADARRRCEGAAAKAPAEALEVLPPAGSERDIAPTRLVLRPGMPTTMAGVLFSMYVMAENDIVSDNIIKYGTWEGGDAAQVMARLHSFAEHHGLARSDVWMVDVGGNLGYFSMMAAAEGFSVLTFEPLAANVAALRGSLCASRGGLGARVALVPKGLGAAAASCALISGRVNAGDGTVLCGASADDYDKSAYVLRATLDVERLDDVLSPEERAFLRGRVGMLKIDVEGAEPAVLAGAAAFFREVAPANVLTEVSGMQDRNGGTGPYLAAMAKLGYEVRRGGFEGAAIPRGQLQGWRLEEGAIENYHLVHTRPLSPR